MNSFEHKMPETTTQDELLAKVEELNNDPEVHGILVQLPLPPQIDDHAVINAIDPSKDVDGFHAMRAVICNEWCGPDDLRVGEMEDPAPSASEVLIEVKAAGVNFADTLMIAGKYQEKPPFPFAPGLEAAGVVRAVGDAVTRIKPGDRVLGLTNSGAYAELAVATESDVFPIPDSMPFDYARLPFVAALAYLLYGEVADIWTWTGAGIIAMSAFYIANREAKVARLRKSAQIAGQAPTGRP